MVWEASIKPYSSFLTTAPQLIYVNRNPVYFLVLSNRIQQNGVWALVEAAFVLLCPHAFAGRLNMMPLQFTFFFSLHSIKIFSLYYQYVLDKVILYLSQVKNSPDTFCHRAGKRMGTSLLSLVLPMTGRAWVPSSYTSPAHPSGTPTDQYYYFFLLVACCLVLFAVNVITA